MKKLCLVLLGRRPWQGAPHPLHWVLPDRFLSVDLKSHSIRAENVFYLIKKLQAKEKQINFECQVIIKIFLFFLGGKVNQITQFLTFWKMMNWFLLNNLWMFLTSNTFFFSNLDFLWQIQEQECWSSTSTGVKDDDTNHEYYDLVNAIFPWYLTLMPSLAPSCR